MEQVAQLPGVHPSVNVQLDADYVLKLKGRWVGIIQQAVYENVPKVHADALVASIFQQMQEQTAPAVTPAPSPNAGGAGPVTP